MTKQEKEKILTYLNSGEEIAAGGGYVMDHKSGEYTRIALLAYSDGAHVWTNEQMYNFEKNDEVFDEKLFEYILKKTIWC